MDSQFITPAVTVFDVKGRPDKENSHRLYAHLRRGGVTGFVVMGSTGEFFSLDMARSKEIIDIAASFDRGPMRVFAGASRMDPDESVALADYALDKGLDGVMIISPYYFPLNDAGVYEYFTSIASRTAAKIFLYNFPARTGYSLSPEVTLKLAEKHKNIIGFKDTILDMGHTSELIKRVKNRLPYFEVFSGFDNNFVHNILSGGNGCIGGLSNLVPELFGSLIKALRAGDLTEIAKGQRAVDMMMDIYGIGDLFIPIIKKALVLRGVISSDKCTPPILQADEDQTRRIQNLFTAMEIA